MMSQLTFACVTGDSSHSLRRTECKSFIASLKSNGRKLIFIIIAIIIVGVALLLFLAQLLLLPGHSI